MAHVNPVRTILPRPRIPNVLGILNIIFAAGLMLFSIYCGWYAAIMPASMRAIAQMRKQLEVDGEARRQAELAQLDRDLSRVANEDEREALLLKRAAVETRPKPVLPMGMDLEKLGINVNQYVIFWSVDVSTALVLDILMIVAGVGLLQRRLWGLKLAIATAAAKLVRLLVVFGYVALVLIPSIAQGSAHAAYEMIIQQQKAMGQTAPPPIDLAFFTRMYYVMYTGMAVSVVLFGSVYPAISLWFLSRPGARAACTSEARHFRALSRLRVLGTLNVVFASCLIVAGLCFGAYIAALPVLGRTLVQIQKQAEQQAAARREAALESIAEAEKKATTASEKTDLRKQRAVIESRPQPPDGTAAVNFSQMGLDDPRLQAFYWIDVTSGLLLNVAMITAGIGLLRSRRWGTKLGIGTAAAKIVRLAMLYTCFAVVFAPFLAEKSAEMAAKMMLQQQVILGQGGAVTPGTSIDSSALKQLYRAIFPPIAVGMIVFGSIYPALSIWLLMTAPAEPAVVEKTSLPELELGPGESL